jgi:hypothetical protein
VKTIDAYVLLAHQLATEHLQAEQRAAQEGNRQAAVWNIGNNDTESLAATSIAPKTTVLRGNVA